MLVGYNLETDHGHQSQITFSLQVCFNKGKATTRRLCDSFDEEAFPDTQLNTNIIWTQLEPCKMGISDRRCATHSVDTKIDRL